MRLIVPFLCTWCLFADTSPQVLHDPRSSELQNILMGLFFLEISPKGREWFASDFSADQYMYCNFHGVTCEKGVITRVFIYRRAYGNFNIYALPPTIRKINILDSQQNFKFNTHALPRELVRLHLAENRIRGTINLTCLPVNLEYLNLERNKLKGIINLTMLPRKMRFVYLDQNNFRQSTVWYDNLPETIRKIRLVGSGYLNRQHFREIRAVYPENSVTDKTIFLNVKAECVF